MSERIDVDINNVQPVSLLLAPLFTIGLFVLLRHRQVAFTPLLQTIYAPFRVGRHLLNRVEAEKIDMGRGNKSKVTFAANKQRG
jgi:hypothetical protein